MQVTGAYPPDAAYGGDFLSGAAQRKIVERMADGGERLRPERIVLTDRAFDMEDVVLHGRVCLSEQSIRALGDLVDLVSREVVERVEVENKRLRAELAEMSEQNLDLKAALASLKRVERWEA